MPDDPNAALIERMVSVYDDAPPEMGADEAMSRVLAIVREHEGQELAEAQKRIAAAKKGPPMRSDLTSAITKGK